MNEIERLAREWAAADMNMTAQNAAISDIEGPEYQGWSARAKEAWGCVVERHSRARRALLAYVAAHLVEP